jgi:hypothetical protein
MGWLHDRAPGHEGYVVALVEEMRPGGYSRWVELAYPDELAKRVVPVRMIQVGCECGWRSRRFRAPSGTTWSPFSVTLEDKEAEAEACALWERHALEEHASVPKRLEPPSSP